MRAKIIEIDEFRDQRHVFVDRFNAGEALGVMLRSEYGNIDDGMIMAIPAGGIPVGMKVKETLGLPLDLVIVRKLQIPGNPEAGFGAMTLDGTTFFNETLLKQLRLKPGQIDAEKKRVGDELEKRNALFRGNQPFPDLTGKRVILVDDGVASGFTMLASVDMAQKAKARETVIAVPTAPLSSIKRMVSEVDKIYCANIRTGPFFAVADAYQYWHDLDEGDVLDLLKSHKCSV